MLRYGRLLQERGLEDDTGSDGMRWSWVINVGLLAVQFLIAGVLVPDMRRRKVQWWWQALVIWSFLPSSIVWLWVVHRRDVGRA